MNPEALQFIRDHLAIGQSEQTIRNHFLQNGWTQTDVDRLFQDYNTHTATTDKATIPAKTKSTLKPWLIALPIVALLLLGGSIFWLHNRVQQSSDPEAVISTNMSAQEAVSRAAVPALQRSSRNIAAKNDVSQLATAVSEYMSNNRGALPLTIVEDVNKTLSLCGNNCEETVKTTVALQFYENTPQAIQIKAYKPDLVVKDLKSVFIVPAAACSEDVIAAGPARSVALLYATEEGNNPQPQCMQL